MSQELQNDLDNEVQKQKDRTSDAINHAKRKLIRKGSSAHTAGKAAAGIGAGEGAKAGVSSLASLIAAHPIATVIIIFCIIFFIMLLMLLSYLPASVTLPDMHGSSKQIKDDGIYASINKQTDDSSNVLEAYESLRKKLNVTLDDGSNAIGDDSGDGSSSTAASGSAKKLLDIANQQVTRWQSNGGHDGGFYAKAMGGSAGQPWCGYFKSWCAKEAGISSSVIARSGMARADADAGKKDGTWRDWTYTPQPGDIIMFDWGGGHGSIDHVGIVESVSGDTINTIEGNTGNSQCLKKKRKKAFVAGYRHPHYADTSNNSSNSEEEPTEDYTADDYHTIDPDFYDNAIGKGWQASAMSDADALKKAKAARTADIKKRVAKIAEDKYKEKAASGYFVISCFSVSLSNYHENIFDFFSITDVLKSLGFRMMNSLRTALQTQTIDRDEEATIPALYIKYNTEDVYELDKSKSNSEDDDPVYIKNEKEATGREKVVESFDSEGVTYQKYKKGTVRQAYWLQQAHGYSKPASGDSIGYKKGDPGRPYFSDKQIYEKDGTDIAKTDKIKVHVHKEYTQPLRRATYYAFFFGYPSQEADGMMESDSDQEDDGGSTDASTGTDAGSSKSGDEFYQKYKKEILQGWKEYHLYPSVTIAQAQQETTFGQSGVGRAPNNNLYGISGNGVHGSPYWKKSYGTSGRPEGGVYHKYPNKELSILDRNYWLGTMSNYKSVRNAKSAGEQATALAKSGWAAAGYSSSGINGMTNKYKKYDKDLPSSSFTPGQDSQGKYSYTDSRTSDTVTSSDGSTRKTKTINIGGAIKDLISGKTLEENLEKLKSRWDTFTKDVQYALKHFWLGVQRFAGVKVSFNPKDKYYYPDGDEIQYAPYAKYDDNGELHSPVGEKTYDDYVTAVEKMLKQYLYEMGYNGTSSDNGIGNYIWPFDKNKYGKQCQHITSYFGNRKSPGGIGSKNHKGIDIAWGGCKGAEIRAPADGKVIFAGHATGFGNCVEIQHANNIVTQYGHIEDGDLKCKVGDSATQGNTIALVGNAGHSTGPHLHMGAFHASGVAWGSTAEAFDPLELFTKAEHPEGKNPGNSGGSGSLVGNSNAEKIFNYFVGKGFTKQAAAGIVGNLMQESSCNPNSKQRGGPGRGIAQWSVGERWAEMQRWKGSRSEWDLGTQLDWLYHEMQTSRKSAMSIKNMTDVHQATLTFEKKFEAAGKPNMSNRYKYADQAYKSFANKNSGI